MNSSQNTIFNFLGHLTQSLSDRGFEHEALLILDPSMKYIQSCYTDKPMTEEELAGLIADRFRAQRDEQEAFQAELDTPYPKIG